MTTKTKTVSDKEAASYFLKLFDLNIIPMSTWKYDGTLTSVNDAFLEMIGYSRKDFEKGKINWKNMTPPGYEKADNACIKELKAKGYSTSLVKEYICKDGSHIRVRIANVLVNHSDDHGLDIFFRL